MRRLKTLSKRRIAGQYTVSGLLWIAVLTVPGCKAYSPDALPSSEAEFHQMDWPLFTRTFQQVLRRDSLRANQEKWVGSVELATQFNRKNQVVSCTARAIPDSPPQPGSSASKLEEMVRAVCWNTVFPMLPATVFNVSGLFTVSQTLVFPRLELEPEQSKKLDLNAEQYARGHYFWEHTLANLPVDGVGVASFRVKADPQGRVQECKVSLREVSYRAESFKPDKQLRERATRLCEWMNLLQMPGFVLIDGKLPTVSATVLYTPWKGGPDKFPLTDVSGH